MTDCGSIRSTNMRRLLLLAAWLACLFAAPTAHAADPQPYKVDIKKTGESMLDTALNGSSQLESLREKAPVGPFALVSRARQDIDRRRPRRAPGYARVWTETAVPTRCRPRPAMPPRLGSGTTSWHLSRAFC